MNLLLERFFAKLYPTLEVECGLVSSPVPNAKVFGFRERGRLFVTTAALERIHDAGRRIHMSPIFRPSVIEASAAPPKVFDEEMTTMAFAALLGHELGHLHDRRLYPRSRPFAKPAQIETQALEFSADTWGLRACTDLMLAPLRDCSLDVRKQEDAILVGATRALIGHGLLDRLDWVQPWVAPDNGWPYDHPQGARRLFVGSVAILEWLRERQTFPDATAMGICAASFDTAARALHWYATGQVKEAEHFLKVALAHHHGGASIELWREAYERFQEDLLP